MKIYKAIVILKDFNGVKNEFIIRQEANNEEMAINLIEYCLNTLYLMRDFELISIMEVIKE